jgi:transcriptional regulator with XRE-family HTH domain
MMPEPLWKIRERKGMSVNELAAKSGVPAISINEYESGRAIRSADLPKLAKALYVEDWDIELKSPPRPRAKRTPKETAAPAAPKKKEPETPKPTTSTRAQLVAARPTQIEHLLQLASGHFGKDEKALTQEIGKPLDQLTRQEASGLLREYQQQLAQRRSDESGEDTSAKRRRAYLPEGVDEFELEYLSSHRDAGTLLHFALFDGQSLSGRLIGFGPYSITIENTKTGQETTLQKLAIAYYRTVDPIPNDAERGMDAEQQAFEETQ